MKKLTLFLAFVFFGAVGFAQIQDPESNSGGYGSENPDSTLQQPQLDENGNPIEGSEGGEVIPAKPYERIVLTIDSVTNKITYLEVIEQEESGSDSLYTRAKRWAQVRFGKGGDKGLFQDDKKNQRLIINGVLTAYRYNSKYTKRDVGKYYFQMTVWIKEGRYRYQITNLVHEGIKPNNGVPSRNYFEFYYTSPKNVKPYDQLLRDADTDIKKLMADFVKSMKDPIIVDEDDW
jgi:hypothetical protein